MLKPPFEKVFSLVERKKLFLKVAGEQSRVLVKNPSNELFDFYVRSVDKDFNLEGDFPRKSPKDFEKVTALFYVDRDRYFLTTRIKQKKDHWLILNSSQFFRLNRRQAFRISIPVSVDLSWHLSAIRNIEVHKKISIIEFSSGGAKIHWPGDKKLAKGTHLRGVLQWGKSRVLSVDGTVVHSSGAGIYGVRFINLSSVTVSRLKMLSIEIQQTIHFLK